MDNISSYILSAYSFIFRYPLDKLLDVGYKSKNGNPIPSFDQNLLINLCSEAENIFAKENNILELEGDFIIVGDIHGSLHDLLRILKFIQYQKSKVLFLGDYVDRGEFSLECITLLFALKLSEPEKYFLIRGNHEFEATCSQYGFKDEILNYNYSKKVESLHPKMNPNYPRSSSSFFDLESSDQIEDYHHFYANVNCYTYTETLYLAFMKTFSYLPIAAILNKTTFCIHGGLSPSLDHADNLNKFIKRPITKIEENSILSDVMWSDPSNCVSSLFEENPRGMGYLYSGESVSKFLKASSLKRLIRAHQCVSLGVLKFFSDKCITVFSASSYDMPMGNSSSILQLFQQDDTIQIQIFDPLTRLPKNEAYYYKVQSLSSSDEKIHICFSLLHPKLPSNANNRPSVLKNAKQIRSHISETNLYNLRYSSSRFLLKPKFVTSQRKSIQFPIGISNASCTTSTSEYEENSA